MNSKISIIIPTYNGEKYIRRAVESVLNQTFQDFEIIVVDDFSSDKTIEIVKELQEKDSRIKLICLEKNSGGPAHPKNEGFKIASGRYLAYLDQDDEWMANKLEEQINFFENSKDKKIGLVSCGASLINTSGEYFGSFIPVKNRSIFPEILLRNPIYSNSSVLIKREVIEDVGGRDENMRYSEDLEMWIRIAGYGYDFGYICKPLFKYYFHNNNVTNTASKIMKVRDMEYIFEKHKNLYEKYNYMYIGFFRLGVMYFLGGDSKKSRQCFLESIKINKMFVPAYIGYIISTLGKVGAIIINCLIFCYRLFHGKKYLLLPHFK